MPLLGFKQWNLGGPLQSEKLLNGSTAVLCSRKTFTMKLCHKKICKHNIGKRSLPEKKPISNILGSSVLNKSFKINLKINMFSTTIDLCTGGKTVYSGARVQCLAIKRLTRLSTG